MGNVADNILCHKYSDCKVGFYRRLPTPKAGVNMKVNARLSVDQNDMSIWVEGIHIMISLDDVLPLLKEASND